MCISHDSAFPVVMASADALNNHYSADVCISHDSADVINSHDSANVCKSHDSAFPVVMAMIQQMH